MDIEPVLRNHILTLWRMNARARGLKPSMVSMYAAKDGEFFERLARQARDDRQRKERVGRQRASVTLRKFDEVVRYFEDKANWPNGEMPPLAQIKIKVVRAKSNGRRSADQVHHRAGRRDRRPADAVG